MNATTVSTFLVLLHTFQFYLGSILMTIRLHTVGISRENVLSDPTGWAHITLSEFIRIPKYSGMFLNLTKILPLYVREVMGVVLKT